MPQTVTAPGCSPCRLSTSDPTLSLAVYPWIWSLTKEGQRSREKVGQGCHHSQRWACQLPTFHPDTNVKAAQKMHLLEHQAHSLLLPHPCHALSPHLPVGPTQTQLPRT